VVQGVPRASSNWRPVLLVLFLFLLVLFSLLSLFLQLLRLLNGGGSEDI